jgi:hypothetical protein
MEKLLSVGIDDLATEMQLSEGWTFFLIEKELVNEFSEKAKIILDKICIDSFHGKKYKRRFKTSYLEFLELCREYSEKSSVSLISVVLQDLNWKNQYVPFTKRVIKNVLSNNDINEPEILASSQKLVAPLFSLQAQTNNLSHSFNIEILVDSDSITESFDNLSIELTKPQGSITITSKKLLSFIYNGYRNLQFPNSPTLIKEGISVKPDESSFLIQASDIIGNFCLSYIKKKLGYTSKTINQKAELFSRVFGDKFDDIDLNNVLEITSSNEIKLKFSGQQVLKFGKFEDDNNCA